MLHVTYHGLKYLLSTHLLQKKPELLASVTHVYVCKIH